MQIIRAPKAKRVAVAISGGVDSAVAAALIRHSAEYRDSDIVGVFMRNWDEAEERSEASNSNCSIEADYRDAASVCRTLQLPLVELDFVQTYYNKVFAPFLESLRRGGTPNPDVACNRVVKFDALLEACRRDVHADMLVTGHYARVVADDRDMYRGEDRWKLMRARDAEYDQTYFLSSINREVLRHVLFPLGDLMKKEVRDLAKDFGLTKVSDKKSSTGICFIGKRNFGAFVEEYLPAHPGVFVDVEQASGVEFDRGAGRDIDGDVSMPNLTPLAQCRNIHALTYGQNAGIGGLPSKAFVVGKDLKRNLVYVCRDREHPSLYTRTALMDNLHWLSESHQQAWEATYRLSTDIQGLEQVPLTYKARYREPQKNIIEMVMDKRERRTSRYWVLEDDTREGVVEDRRSNHCVWIEFAEPAFAITPGQYIVLYAGDVCIASARIVLPGETLHEVKSEFGVKS